MFCCNWGLAIRPYSRGAQFADLLKVLSSLALPTYILPLNLDFASVLGLVLRYALQILEIDFLFAPISEQREWLRTITLTSCASLCCSSVMAAEKDASETMERSHSVRCGNTAEYQETKSGARTSVAEFSWWQWCSERDLLAMKVCTDKEFALAGRCIQ